MRQSFARSRHLVGLFPHGIATIADLTALGISRSTITRRCRPGGPWSTMLLGQVRMTNGPVTEAQRMYSTLLHVGPGGMYTGITGARLHGVAAVPPESRVHVLMPAGKQVSSRDFALVTRTTRMPDPVRIGGAPVAPLARCIVDAATRTDRIDVVRALVADAVQRKLCSPDDFVEELVEPRRPGTALARAVLAEIRAGVRSAAEAWARDLVTRSGLPEPQWNVELRTPAGRSLGVVDAYWEEVGLAWEIQSRTFHLSPRSHARDVQKAADLAAVGVRLLPSMANDLRRWPADVLRHLDDAYDHASRSPRPDVVATPYRPV